MANLNKVMLIGRLTRDPETRYTSGGTAVCEIGLAVNESWTDKQGNRQENTAYVDITLWGRQAEIADEYLNKGSQVFIEGKLKLDQWETREGEKRSKLKVTATGMQFIGSRQGGGQQQQQQSQGQMAYSGTPEEEIPF